MLHLFNQAFRNVAAQYRALITQFEGSLVNTSQLTNPMIKNLDTLIIRINHLNQIANRTQNQNQLLFNHYNDAINLLQGILEIDIPTLLARNNLQSSN